jgi:hypothetical protein
MYFGFRTVPHNANVELKLSVGPLETQLPISSRRRKDETENRNYHVCGNLWTRGAIFARYGATKDRQGMPRGVAGQ